MNDECCATKVAEFVNEFKTVDNDFYVRKIHNAFIGKMDGRCPNENWISKEFAVPTVDHVKQLLEHGQKLAND